MTSLLIPIVPSARRAEERRLPWLNGLVLALTFGLLSGLLGWRVPPAEAELGPEGSDLNDLLRRLGIPGLIYGETSVFTIMLGAGIEEAVRTSDVGVLMGARGAAALLRKGMLLEGIDLMRSGGFTSIAHTEADIDRTVSGFERVVGRMQREGAV